MTGQVEPRSALTDAKLAEIAERWSRPLWGLTDEQSDDVPALLDEARRRRAHAARLAFQIEEMRRDRDVAVAECQRSAAMISSMQDHTDRLEAIVDAALAWERARQCMFEPGMNEQNPELHVRASAHSQRETELRALLRAALLEPPTTTGRVGESAPTGVDRVERPSHPFYQDPHPRVVGRCDYTAGNGDWCNLPPEAHPIPSAPEVLP